MNLIQHIKKAIPPKLFQRLKDYKTNAIALLCFLRNKRNLRAVAGKKDVYNVLFFLESSALWKYNHLYRLMQYSKCFNPTLVVCPNRLREETEMQDSMLKTYDEMLSFGFNVVLGYDIQKKEYINVRTLDPQIIFFTNSWEQYLDERFHIAQYSDILTCYMNYSFVTTPHKWSFVTNISARVWRYFQECNEYNKLLKTWTPGRNAIVSGYTLYDEFINHDSTGEDWKRNDKLLKRVI